MNKRNRLIVLTAGIALAAGILVTSCNFSGNVEMEAVERKYHITASLLIKIPEPSQEYPHVLASYNELRSAIIDNGSRSVM